MQVGRRSLLISGSILGLLADFAVAIVFALSYSGGPNLPTGASIAAIVLVSVFLQSSDGFSNVPTAEYQKWWALFLRGLITCCCSGTLWLLFKKSESRLTGTPFKMQKRCYIF